MAHHRDPPSQPQREHHQGRTGGAGLGSAAPQALGSPASAPAMRAHACACVCVRVRFFGTKYTPCTSTGLKVDIAFKHSKAHCLI